VRSECPTIADPAPLFVQFPQVISWPAANAVPSGCVPGKNVVHVRTVAATVDDSAFLGQRRLLGEVIGAVQLGDILGDDDAFRIGPGPAPDAVTRIHCIRHLAC
jgi:hypothetical protein